MYREVESLGGFAGGSGQKDAGPSVLAFFDADQMGTRVAIRFFTPFHPISKLAIVYRLQDIEWV
jgi:hypothetical protein